MRSEFNNLVDLMQKYDLYQTTDEVGIAVSELEKKITEVEKRLGCVLKTNQDVSDVMFKYQEQITNVVGYDNMEVVERSINDINIAIDLTDKEPIDNNWYGLFEEPKKEEPKVLIPKGSIIEWGETIKYFSAKKGAKARVLEDYTTEHESNDKTIQIEWIDELANGQDNGGYYLEKFKEGFELPNAPTELCKTPQTHEFVKDIIAKLKVIDVDGETMEYILEQVGMAEQMLRQLVMSNPESDTKDLLEEKRMISDEHLSKKNRGCIEI